MSLHVCLYRCLFICTYLCLYSMSACVYVYVYACVCVCTYFKELTKHIMDMVDHEGVVIWCQVGRRRRWSRHWFPNRSVLCPRGYSYHLGIYFFFFLFNFFVQFILIIFPPSFPLMTSQSDKPVGRSKERLPNFPLPTGLQARKTSRFSTDCVYQDLALHPFWSLG